jgi:hypothetical protein
MLDVELRQLPLVPLRRELAALALPRSRLRHGQSTIRRRGDGSAAPAGAGGTIPGLDQAGGVAGDEALL